MEADRCGVWGLFFVGLGCGGEIRDRAGELPQGASSVAVSPAFRLGAAAIGAPGRHATPDGEGVALRWDDRPGFALPVVTTGLGPVATTATRDGDVTLTHDRDVEERWRQVPEGMEQSWRFATRPSDGRVAVDVRFDGATFDHASEDGVWLRAGEGVLLRYSHATWIGADGARTAVAVRWSVDHLALEVPSGVVATTRFPAVLDPTVTARFALTESQPMGRPNVAGIAAPPDLVQVGDSTLFFSVRRVGASATGLVTVQRFDSAGAYVPGSFRGVPASVFVGYGGSRQTVFGASYGTGAMVVIQTSQGLVAARLDPTGRSIDRAPVILAAATTIPILNIGGLSCSGTTCLTAYIASSFAGGVGPLFVQRVGTDGRALDASPVRLAALASGFSPQPVVALSDRFIVGWTTQPTGGPVDIRFARVGLDGTIRDPDGLPVSIAGASRTDLSIATDGTRIFLKWFATASGSRPTGVYTQTFDADLNPLSPLGVHPDLPSGMSLWWDGSAYVLADTTRLVRFDAVGVRLDATPRLVPDDTTTWLGVGRDRFFAYGSEGRLYRYDTLGARVGSPTPVVVGYYEPSVPAVTFDGDAFLASWREETATSPRVALARVRASGVVLDSPPVTVTAPGNTLVALEGSRAQVFTGSQRIAVDLPARTAAPPEALATPLESIVRGGAQRLMLSPGCATRFDASWRRLDPAPVCYGTATFGLPSAGAFDGTNFLFAYASGDEFSQRIFARRVNLDGDVVDLTPRSLGLTGGTAPPAVAFGAGAYLVARVNGTSVYAVRLALDGTPGPTQTLGGIGAGPGRPPVGVVFDGTNFVVGWASTLGTSLQASRVSPAGVVLDSRSITLSSNEDAPYPGQPGFSMASDGAGSTLFVYGAYDLDLASFQMRGVFFREDGTVVPDGGAPVVDVPPATDSGPIVVDVPPATDLGPMIDAVAPVDVGIADASEPVDAGPTGTDVAVVATDVGRTDAGADVSVGDAGSGTDAAVVDAGAPPADDGGCSASPGSSSRGREGVFAVTALALALGRRRPRRSATTRDARARTSD